MTLKQEFEEWLKYYETANGEKIIRLRVANKGDCKNAFLAGAAAQKAKDVETARKWRGIDSISCSHRLDIAEAIERGE